MTSQNDDHKSINFRKDEEWLRLETIRDGAIRNFYSTAIAEDQLKYLDLAITIQNRLNDILVGSEAFQRSFESTKSGDNDQ